MILHFFIMKLCFLILKVKDWQAIDSFHLDIIHNSNPTECFTSAMEYIYISIRRASIDSLFTYNVQRLDDERPVFVVASIVIGSGHWRAESQKRANATIRRLFTRSTLPDAHLPVHGLPPSFIQTPFPRHFVQCGPVRP